MEPDETEADEPLIIKLPANGWVQRDYQLPLWHFLQHGGKRAIAIWPRRTGKDDVALHRTSQAMIERVGNYWHSLPQYSQGRKAIWSAVNPVTGMRRIDEAFPVELRASTNDNEMFLRYKNGSTFQVIGSDEYDRTVGSSPAGIVFSEWALSNPSAWAYMRPILEENNGWALFISTPRGRNHCKTMYDMALQHPAWFAQRLTIDDTGTMNPAQLRDTLTEYIGLYGEDYGRSMFQQEYMTSFNVALLGSFYAGEMLKVREEGRILEVEPNYDLPVSRAWDIGVDDDTCIWWFQVHGPQLVVLDCYASSGAGVEHYAEIIKDRQLRHGWKNGTDWVPHDAKVLEWGSGKTRVETMQALNLNPAVAPNVSKMDGINAVRRTLPMAVFHPRCEHGIAALEQYRREWDDERKAFKQTEYRDWSTHPCDAFRYLSLAWRTSHRAKQDKPAIRRGIMLPPPPQPRPGRIVL
jgi:phage terminase large subunit